MLAQFAWCTSVISPWETSYQREKTVWPKPTTFEKGSKSVQNVDRQILQLAPFEPEKRSALILPDKLYLAGLLCKWLTSK